jgi:SSS family transporter
MNALDYVVVALYMGGLLFFGYLLRNQSSEGDYFLGGRSMGWFPLTLSTMATQLSAISFVSAPAFVGLREGGGLKWLTYEFSLPLAMILVMFVIAPALYRAGIVSIYDYLEQRFGRSTRILISVNFQVVRSFATGIMVYAMGLILEAVIGIPLWQSLFVVGVITLIYSTSGGMKAVVYGDAIQMVLIFGGLLVVTFYALADIGGMGAFWREVDPGRLVAVDFNSLGLNGDEFGFIPMLFGGFVLYASYYGCDQTQAQRIISAKDIKDTRVLLFANGVLRFPLVLLYCFAGLIVGVAIANDPGLAAKIPADKPDYMMPIFIIEHLPHGVIGLLLVAIMAAAMSSLSSAVNSLAAVTMEDLAVLGYKPADKQREVLLARGVSVFWGITILIMSLFAGSIAPTVIEAINKVGSALYGPILGVFLIGMLSRRVNGVGASAGLLAGMFFNLYLWKAEPQIFWMWWNFIGLVITVVVAGLVGIFTGRISDDIPSADHGSTFSDVARSPYTILLLAMFTLIVVVSTVLKDAQSWFVQ